MKRKLIVKCLLFAVVALVAVFARADMAPLPQPTYHALSRSEWEREMAKIEQEKVWEEQARVRQERWQRLGKIGVAWAKLSDTACSSLFAYVLALVSPCIFGILTIVFLRRSIRFRRRKYFVGTALTFLLLILSSAFLYLEFFLGPHFLLKYDAVNAERMNFVLMDSPVRDDITVDPKLGETYEEYKSRVYEYNHPRPPRRPGRIHFFNDPPDTTTTPIGKSP